MRTSDRCLSCCLALVLPALLRVYAADNRPGNPAMPAPPITWNPAGTLKVERLQDELKSVVKAAKYKDALAGLQRQAAEWTDREKIDEAERISRRILAYGTNAVAQAMRLEDVNPRVALTLYKLIIDKYEGLEAAGIARERVDGETFKRKTDAWNLYDRTARYARSFKKAPGMDSNINDRRWSKLNETSIRYVRACLTHMRRFADTAYAVPARDLAGQYGITDPQLDGLIKENALDDTRSDKPDSVPAPTERE